MTTTLTPTDPAATDAAVILLLLAAVGLYTVVRAAAHALYVAVVYAARGVLALEALSETGYGRHRLSHCSRARHAFAWIGLADCEHV